MSHVRVLLPIHAPFWGGLHACFARIAPHFEAQQVHATFVIPKDADGRVHDAFREFDTIVTPLSRLRYSFNPRTQFSFWTNTLQQDIQTLMSTIRSRDIQLISPIGAHHIQGALAGKRTGIPVLWQIHGASAPAWARKVLSRVISHYSSGVMFNGVANEQRFSIHESVPRYHFLPSVEGSKFEFRLDSRQRIRDRLGVSQDTIVLGTVGNRTRVKRHDRIIDVLLRLKRKHPSRSFHVLIVGHEVGSQERWYANHVKRLVQRHHLESRVHFKCGDESYVAESLSAMDAFLLTSDSEGMPLSIAEAALSGLPIFTHDGGSVRDFEGLIPQFHLSKFGDIASIASDIGSFAFDIHKRNKVDINSFNSCAVAAQFASAFHETLTPTFDCHSRREMHGHD